MNVATCARGIETRLGGVQGVTLADASYVTQTVTVRYDERQISEDALRGLVEGCGFACGEPMVAGRMLHAAAALAREQDSAPAAKARTSKTSNT